MLDSQKKGGGCLTSVKEWMLIDILTSTGIRVAECADLRCGDIKAGYGQSELHIRNGKDSKSHEIQTTDQAQMGHSNIQTTQIYADMTEEDIQQNVKGLWSYKP